MGPLLAGRPSAPARPPVPGRSMPRQRPLSCRLRRSLAPSQRARPRPAGIAQSPGAPASPQRRCLRRQTVQPASAAALPAPVRRPPEPGRAARRASDELAYVVCRVSRRQLWTRAASEPHLYVPLRMSAIDTACSFSVSHVGRGSICLLLQKLLYTGHEPLGFVYCTF